MADYLVIETTDAFPHEVLGQQKAKTAQDAAAQARMINAKGVRIRIRTPGGDEYSLAQFELVMLRDLR